MSDLVDFKSECGLDNNEALNETVTKKHVEKRKRIWIKSKEFSTPELAENFVNSQNTWKKTTSYQSSDGFKIFYRCTAGEYRKNECPAGIYLLFHADRSDVSLYESQNDHNNHMDKTRGLSRAMREVVHQLLEDGIRKPNAIIAAFRNRGLEEPEKLKLKNYLAQLRLPKLGPPTISVNELINWCNAQMNVPDDEDTPFVLGAKIGGGIGEQNDLKIVISTKRLLELVNKCEGVQTDSTYKWIWQGYPVLIVGSSDLECVFHPFAIAVCYNETEFDFAFIFNCIRDSCRKLYGTEWNPKILLADASCAITNAFRDVFGISFRRLMCYFHVLKHVDSKLRCIKEKDEIRNDIECLHLCADDDTFTVVSELFLKKWTKKNDASITVFMEYFKTTWLTDFRYWYIGARNYFPITNNGLEATYAIIKKEHTLRERLPVGQFLELLENVIVKKWSSERDPQNPNYKPFYINPQLSTEIWTEAYHWSKADVNILEEKNEKQSVFYIPSSKLKQMISVEMVNLKKNSYLKWETFEEYSRDNENSIWEVKVSDSETNGFVSTCSCTVFSKKYVCKHSLGILIHLGIMNVPYEAISLPLGQKRKRGRPLTTKKALFVQ